MDVDQFNDRFLPSFMLVKRQKQFKPRTSNDVLVQGNANSLNRGIYFLNSNATLTSQNNLWHGVLQKNRLPSPQQRNPLMYDNNNSVIQGKNPLMVVRRKSCECKICGGALCEKYKKIESAFPVNLVCEHMIKRERLHEIKERAKKKTLLIHQTKIFQQKYQNELRVDNIRRPNDRQSSQNSNLSVAEDMLTENQQEEIPKPKMLSVPRAAAQPPMPLKLKDLSEKNKIPNIMLNVPQTTNVRRQNSIQIKYDGSSTTQNLNHSGIQSFNDLSDSRDYSQRQPLIPQQRRDELWTKFKFVLKLVSYARQWGQINTDIIFSQYADFIKSQKKSPSKDSKVNSANEKAQHKDGEAYQFGSQSHFNSSIMSQQKDVSRFDYLGLQQAQNLQYLFPQLKEKIQTNTDILTQNTLDITSQASSSPRNFKFGREPQNNAPGVIKDLMLLYQQTKQKPKTTSQNDISSIYMKPNILEKEMQQNFTAARKGNGQLTSHVSLMNLKENMNNLNKSIKSNSKGRPSDSVMDTSVDAGGVQEYKLESSDNQDEVLQSKQLLIPRNQQKSLPKINSQLSNNPYLFEMNQKEIDSLSQQNGIKLISPRQKSTDTKPTHFFQNTQ